MRVRHRAKHFSGFNFYELHSEVGPAIYPTDKNSAIIVGWVLGCWMLLAEVGDSEKSTDPFLFS